MSELREKIEGMFLDQNSFRAEGWNDALEEVLELINTEGQAGDLRSRVKAAREAGGLSIRALADLTGVSFSSIARFEREDGDLSPDNRKSLKDWLAYLDRPGQAGDVGELVAILEKELGSYFRQVKKGVGFGAIQRLQWEDDFAESTAKWIAGPAHTAGELAAVSAIGDATGGSPAQHYCDSRR